MFYTILDDFFLSCFMGSVINYKYTCILLTVFIFSLQNYPNGKPFIISLSLKSIYIYISFSIFTVWFRLFVCFVLFFSAIVKHQTVFSSIFSWGKYHHHNNGWIKRLFLDFGANLFSWNLRHVYITFLTDLDQWFPKWDLCLFSRPHTILAVEEIWGYCRAADAKES